MSEQIATITLDREKHRNAWTVPMVRALSDALRWCANADEVRVVILTGSGNFFSVGADLAEGFGASAEESGEKNVLHDLVTPRHIDKPVIAAINGDAIGMGVTLSLLCDIRIVATDARMAIPMTRLGVVPELGSHWTLPRLAGLTVASELILTGRRFSGVEAERWGICTRAVPREEVEKEALAMAREIVSRTAPRAVGFAKRLLLDSLEDRFASSMAYESDLFIALARESDAFEGVSAFLEKRPPRWSGSLEDPIAVPYEDRAISDE
ncbi:enoyl-CoA hydratase/isomerase family protein [Rhodococcus sp. DMU1]|uniref:enoyl-CoA hydratase/isomerase family protein n=1 Tax=Rhodococcus sp. DMU1 TaxID=2722825 RepID=UPI00143EE37E|nr:enoyl-CoA hydratase/isomerase family protein [Rhodococcus sp. DMU1]QIX53728.1 enoyl-CoA hydratase/isomerase family protein [Rhodococcus sp. DMU1]